MSQDSLFGQSVTGVRPLDIPINILSTIMAARSGQLGNVLALQQAVKQRGQEQAIERAKALQLPEVRNDPSALEALGIRAVPQPTSALSALTGGRTEQYRRAVHPALPPQVETDESATRILKSAQANQLNAQAERLKALGLMGGAGGGGEGQVELGRTVDPITGSTKIQYGPPKVRTVTAGTKDPRTGKPYEPGKGPAGEFVDVKPGPSTGKIGESIQRAKSSLQNMQRLLLPPNIDPKTNERTGKRPVDIFPDLSGGTGLQGVANTLGRSIAGGVRIPFTDATVGQAWLRDVARDKQNPDSTAAQEILSAAGAITNLVKGFGDAANVAVPEETRLQEAFIPGYGDSPGPGGSAEKKVQIAIELLTNIVTAAEKNPNLTQGEVAALLGQALGAVGLPAPAPKEGYDPNAVVGGQIAAAAGSAGGAQVAGPTDGRGAGPTSDIEQRLLQKYGGQ